MGVSAQEGMGSFTKRSLTSFEMTAAYFDVIPSLSVRLRINSNRDLSPGYDSRKLELTTTDRGIESTGRKDSASFSSSPSALTIAGKIAIEP
jgi:hypothetical protein